MKVPRQADRDVSGPGSNAPAAIPGQRVPFEQSLSCGAGAVGISTILFGQAHASRPSHAVGTRILAYALPRGLNFRHP